MDALSSNEPGAHQALSIAESILASPKVEPSPRNHAAQPPAPLPLSLPSAVSNPVSPTHSTSRSSASSRASDHVLSSSAASTPSHSQTLQSTSSSGHRGGGALSPTSVSSLGSSPGSPSPLSPTSSSASYGSSSVSSTSATQDDHCVLFLGDLARGISEEALGQLFSVYGDVVSVDVKRDKVGDLDGTVTSADLRAAFSPFGPLIDEETFVKANNGRYGFVRFQTRSDAERAKQQMNRKTLGSRPVRLGWGDMNIQKHCVHIQFMPHTTPHSSAANTPQQPLHQLISEAVLHKEFRRFGAIVSVSLPRTAEMRLKGFAFIHFSESEAGEQSAAAAVSTMADGQICGVPVRASYGKRQVAPRYRGRSISGNSNSSLATSGGAFNGRSRSGDDNLSGLAYGSAPAYSPSLPPSSPPYPAFGYPSPPIHSRPASSPVASPFMPLYPPAYYQLSPPLYLLTPSSSPAGFYGAAGTAEPMPLQLGEDGSVGWYSTAGAGGGGTSSGGSVSMRDQLVFQMAAMQQHQQQMYLLRHHQQQQQQQQQQQSQHQQRPQNQLQPPTIADGDQQPMASPGVG